MKQSLSVGITSVSLGWKRILSQEGIEFKSCGFKNPVKPWEFAVVIVNSLLSDSESKNAQTFLQEGGSIITVPEFVKKIDSPTNFIEKDIEFLSPEGNHFRGAGLTWLVGKAALFNGQEKPMPFEKSVGKGFLLVLPFDPEQETLSTAFTKRGFVAGKAAVAEFSPISSKSNIRTITSNCIKRLFELRKLPFVQLGYYPKAFKSVFCFHIDADTYTKDSAKTIELFKELGFNATWFLNLEAAQTEQAPEIVALLKDEPFIGQHAFIHDYFDDQETSFKNVMKGDAEIKKLGFEPNSFSAPNGVWGKGVARAVKKLGYDYAMAFSLDCENFPFNPIVEGKEAGFLFLPTHPVCIGILKAYDYTEGEMIDYYKMVVERNSKAFLPLLLYGHAFKRIARFPNVIRSIFKDVKARKDIWVTNHGGFVLWWKERQRTSFKASFEGNFIEIKTSSGSRASLRVEFEDKQVFLPLKQGVVPLQKLSFGQAVSMETLNDTAPKPSSFGKKHLAKGFISKFLEKAKRLRGK